MCNLSEVHVTLDLATLVFARKAIMDGVNSLEDPFARQQLVHGCQYAIDILSKAIDAKSGNVEAQKGEDTNGEQ